MTDTDFLGDLVKDLKAASNPETAKAKSDICSFAEYVMRDTLGRPFELQPFHREMLEAMTQERFLLIEAARGFGKSRLGAVTYPLWRIMRNRDVRIMIVTESDKLAKNWLREIEGYLASPQYQELVGGDIRPSPLRDRLIWTNTEKIVKGRSPAAQGATLLAVGSTGQIRGRRVDVAICDDIVSENNSATAYQRGILSDWFHAALLPTLDHHPGDPISGQCITLGTPLYDNDLMSELRDRWADKEKDELAVSV